MTLAPWTGASNLDTPPRKLVMNQTCKSIGCCNAVVGQDFCEPCLNKEEAPGFSPSLSDKYPDLYRALGDMAEIDVFAIHHLFNIQDPSGCLQHASRILLTGNTPVYALVREARDTLTRWLQLNQELIPS